MVKPIALIAALAAACGAEHKQLFIPDQMIADSARPVAAPSSSASGDGTATTDVTALAASPAIAPVAALAPVPVSTPASAAPRPSPQNVVLRLAEHGRTWEVQLPDSSGGYELRLPLGDSSAPEKPTAADHELMTAGLKKGESARASSHSYLSGVARAGEMFSSKRYELALIEIVNLETEYPQDSRLQAMKGTVYSRLGKPALARDAWQKALSLDPQDAAVQEALRELANLEENK